jgi:hypothetical protein
VSSIKKGNGFLWISVSEGGLKCQKAISPGLLAFAPSGRYHLIADNRI